MVGVLTTGGPMAHLRIGMALRARTRELMLAGGGAMTAAPEMAERQRKLAGYLTDLYAEGQLSRQEFDARLGRLMEAQDEQAMRIAISASAGRPQLPS